MKTISNYNSEQNFGIEFKESRLKKVIKLINKMQPGEMLDVGCTNGLWGLHWLQKGWNVSGIDINLNNIELANEKGINAVYCDCNLNDLPFNNNKFDFIFAGEIIEHIIDTDGFLIELNRCLKPGGKLIITIPNLVSFENRLRILLGIYPIWVDYSLNGSGHVRAYSPSILKKQCSKNGFTVLKHIGNWIPFIPQRYLTDISMPILSITGDMIPSLSMDIILLLEKKNF